MPGSGSGPASGERAWPLESMGRSAPGLRALPGIPFTKIRIRPDAIVLRAPLGKEVRVERQLVTTAFIRRGEWWRYGIAVDVLGYRDVAGDERDLAACSASTVYEHLIAAGWPVDWRLPS